MTSYPNSKLLIVKYSNSLGKLLNALHNWYYLLKAKNKKQMRLTTKYYYKLLSMFILLSMTLSSYGQNCTFADPQKQAEYNALVDFYNANLYSDLRQDQAWIDLVNGVNCDVCNVVISCNSDGYITRIDGRQQGTDILPTSFGNLKYLETLILTSNAITNLPENFGDLSSLRSLVLTGNLLETLPESIGNLSNLQNLVIQYNNLKTLPESFGNLSNLQSLDLLFNQMETLPESFGNLNNLNAFTIANNQLTSLPESFGNLSSLDYLHLYRNRLSALPESFSNLNLADFRDLRFEDNQITCLPSQIAGSCASTGNFRGNPISLLYTYLYDYCEAGPNAPNCVEPSLQIQENTNGFCNTDGSIDSDNGGFTGTGYINTDNVNGAGIEWTVNASTSGSFYIQWRFANGGSNFRNAKLLINGADVTSFLYFNSTGAWTNWSKSGTLVNLSAGTNTIRLEATQDEGLANIDWIEVYGNTASPGTCDDTNGSNCTFADSQKQAEYDALIDLYNANPNSILRENQDWIDLVNGDRCEVCDLFLTSIEGFTLKVECNTDGYITELNLQSLALSTIPSSIGNLSSLTFLNLKNFNFNLNMNSIFNNTVTSLPESIGNLSSLQELNLSTNLLTSLPESVGNLNNLQGLYLASNQFSNVPGFIGNLPNLTILDLSDNNINCFPSEIVELCNLDDLIFIFFNNPISSQYSNFSSFCENPSDGTCSDSGDEPFLTGNTGQEDCPSPWLDTDNDGICDAADICQGGDDFLDNNLNGIPDECEDGTPSGDPFLTGNTGQEDCPSPWSDTDNDGICDAADICQGGDDFLDNNLNGIPDECEDGTPSGDPFLTGNSGFEDCPSPWLDTDNDGICDAADICQGADDYADIDGDGLPDACDDDNSSSPFLTGNTGNEDCPSPWADTDFDGICDAADICQGANDNLDIDNDGIPDGCDTNVLARIASPERIIAEKMAGRKVNLTWAANEINSVTQYTIQHSTDGQQFQNLITESPRANGDIEVYYDTHTTPALGNNFYRLKIDYADKASEYYEAPPLVFAPTGIGAFPNPVREKLFINLDELMGISAEIKIVSIHGVELMQKSIDADHSGMVEMNMHDIPNGLYSLLIKPNGYRMISQKVAVAKSY